MKLNQKQTIYDIARKAGASPTTVSAALNGTWKARRIRADTVDRIKKIAADLGYSANRQARGLRKAKSGLVGMIIPQHDNRFFSSLSQAFTEGARARGEMPVIISTRRNPAQEAEAVRNLIDYAVDSLMVVGANDPPAISRICREANLLHVFVDQPCADAPSVVTDNASGVRELAGMLIDRAGPDTREGIVFFGGDSRLYATAQRIKGFTEALAERAHKPRPDQIIACGYRRAGAHDALAALYEKTGSLPPALLVNSIACFEGALEFLKTIPEKKIAACRLGVWDYDPFGELWRFPVPMVRQPAEDMVRQAYRHVDALDTRPQLTLIKPELVIPEGY